MRLFLIRHGETVDNVASLYAGSRDSALTNHGAQQARRLGEWFAANKPTITHVFASPLQRTFKTANAIVSAQGKDDLTVAKVAELVEKDFGFYEGKPYSMLSRKSSKAREEARSQTPGFVDVESKDSIARRADAFLDAHLLPLFLEDTSDHVVAIVSHGILLSNLWRRLLSRLQPGSVAIPPDVVASRGHVNLEHLGGWSNTGFLELSIQPLEVDTISELPAFHVDDAKASVDVAVAVVSEPASDVDDTDTASVNATSLPQSTSTALDMQLPVSQSGQLGDVALLRDAAKEDAVISPAVQHLDAHKTTILTINGVPHLAGLKRTRGGIGRAESDEKQRTMDSFFKRVRKE